MLIRLNKLTKKNMKRNRIYLYTLCTALMALMLIACSKGKDYRDVIPADAFMVMSANPKSLAHKAQIGDFTQSPIYAQIEKVVTGEGDMTPEDQEYIMSLIAEPSKAGMSMDHDCFVFFNGKDIARGDDMSIGLVYKVKDRKAIDKFMEWISAQDGSMEKTEVDGLTVFAAGQDSYNPVAFAYNNDAFVLLAAPMNPDGNVEALKALFTQKKDQSIMDKQHAASVLDGSNDMSVFFSYSAIWPAVEQQMGMFGGMPGMEWIGKMSIAVPVNFEKGRVVADMKVFFDDADAEKQYLEITEANMSTNGDLLKYLPEGSAAVVVGGMNGAKTYEILQKIPMYSMVLAMAPQAKTILDMIEGDIVLSFNTMSAGGEFPEATLLAKVNDPKTLETVRELFGMVGISGMETASGKYEGAYDGIPYWYGMHDGIFYATTDARVPALLNGGGASMYDKYGRLFTSSYGGMVIDFTAVKNMLQKLIAEGVIDMEVGMALPYVGMFEDMYMTSTQMLETNVVVNMTDKEKNAADVLYHSLVQLVNMMIGMGI